MDPNLPPLIQALLEPARYANSTTANSTTAKSTTANGPDSRPASHRAGVDQVQLVQTHGAWVLLAGAHAFKIKKPVRYPFMDFSTLALRRAACEAEIRVNRRFEPADPAARLYLETLPITGSTDDPRWGGDPAQAIEWAVRMRRFDEAGRLDHLCARRALTAAHLRSLARQLAAFQSRADTVSAESSLGQPGDTRTFARENLESLRATAVDHTDRIRLQALGDWTEAQFERLGPVLAERRRQGRVREGHGDLHLANLVLIGGAVVPFDAIEFNDRLRWIDVASDTAFAWMDLLHLGAPGLANVLFSEWLDASGDGGAPDVLPFFAVYRALVRAKVAALRREQAGADTTAAREISHHVQLAQRISQPPAPQLLITHGLSGSGKTWASGRWLEADTTGRAIRLRSDVERKRLHGLQDRARSGSGPDSGLYSAGAHAETYASLLSRSAALLQQGWSVVVDAAFLKHAERQAFAALAERLRLPFQILACEAPIDVLRQRIRARAARGDDASEATLAVLERQRGWVEPLLPAERLQMCSAP
jgi:aminoglycoside phosphotransferase family enzyme/predicted kinase